MAYLEKMRRWLQQFPLWQGELATDCTGPKTGLSGLFPLGVTQLSRQEDLLGRVKTRYRAEFLLRRCDIRQEGSLWLLELQSWAMGQKSPGFGDEPETETLRAEKGRLVSASQSGTATFEVKLTVEFTKIM